MTSVAEAFVAIDIPVFDPLDRAPTCLMAPELEYPALAATVAKYSGEIAAAERVLFASGPGEDPLVVQAAALQVARFNLIASALRIHQMPCTGATQAGAASQRLWTERFTAAAIEIFGAPEAGAVGAAASKELEAFRALEGSVDAEALSKLVAALEPLAEGDVSAAEIAAESEKLEVVRAAVGAEMRRRRPEFFALIENGPENYTTEKFANLLEHQLLPLLAREDPLWSRWRVRRKPVKNYSVDPPTEIINAGMLRKDFSRQDALNTAGHELAHAERALNGRKTGDPELTRGLPGNSEIEEGVGMLFGLAASGLAPENAVNFFLDIALALGSPTREPLSRPELFEIAYARATIREQAAGRTPDPEELARTVWGQVNRIYRGTKGNDIVGVFPKDITYYTGFKKAVDYVYDRLQQGYSIKQIVDTLLFARVDPTNSAHCDYVRAHGHEII